MIPKVSKEVLGVFSNQILNDLEFKDTVDIYVKEYEKISAKQPMLKAWFEEFSNFMKDNYPNQSDFPLLIAMTVPVMLLYLEEERREYKNMFD